jgi:hypothetical protein
MKRLFHDVNFFGVKSGDFCYDRKLGGPVKTKHGRRRTIDRQYMGRSPMARLMAGGFLVVCFVLALVTVAVFHSPYSAFLLLLAGAVLFLPGFVLIVLGRRRVALITKVGSAILAAARETGRVNIADIAGQTQVSPDEVRTVIAMLSKRGVLPRDVEVS